MKKILAVLLATSSIAAFAETFQDFNNNAYLQYNNTSMNLGQGNAVGYTLGTTIQAKNNVWINAEAYGSPYNSQNWPVLATSDPANNLGGSTYGQFLATAKAGYAFQFFGDETSGFQVIPYATYTYGTSLGAITQYYGLGVKPEYRLMSDLKVSIDMTGYNATQAGGGSVPSFVNPTFSDATWDTGDVSDFRYTINPEVQYDIAKTILVAGGYKYDQSFNNQLYNAGNNTVYVRVGYLF